MCSSNNVRNNWSCIHPLYGKFCEKFLAFGPKKSNACKNGGRTIIKCVALSILQKSWFSVHYGQTKSGFHVSSRNKQAIMLLGNAIESWIMNPDVDDFWFHQQFSAPCSTGNETISLLKETFSERNIWHCGP